MALKEVKILDLPEDTIVGQDYLLFVHPDGTHNKGRVQDIVDDVVSIVEPNFEERLTAAEDTANSVYDQFSLADGIGTYNATTNVATIRNTVGADTTFTPTTTPAQATGKFFDIIVAGTQSITGTSKDMQVQGKLVSRGAKWDYVPFAIGDSTIAPTKFIPWVSDLFTQLPEYSVYKLAILDTLNRLAFGIRKDGYIEGRFVVEAISMMTNAVHTASVQPKAVTMAKLGDDVISQLPTLYDATFADYLRVYLDEKNRLAFGIKKDGSLIGRFVQADGSVSEVMLTDLIKNKLIQPNSALSRLIQPNSYDVDVEDDGLWRGVEIEIPARTELTGYGFASFPSVKTKSLRGLNNTGTSLLFRKNNNLPVRGKRYRGAFDPTSSGIVGTVLKGYYGNSYTNTYPAFPAGSTGDCWIIDCGNTVTTKTANSLTFKNGDCLVKTAGGYGIQPGPGDGTFREGDFWNVATAGIFAGVSLSATGRLIMIGYESQSGPKYVKYLKERVGEFYLMGEADPSSFTPTTPRNGDLYIFSAVGTTQGIAGIVGDSLIYDGGWGISVANVVTIANGIAFSFPCEKANEWEVRRSDKSVTVVSIAGKGYRTTVRRRVTDELLLISDSLFGVSGVGSAILTATGRAGTVLSYGGGLSQDVLSMLRYHIRQADPYAGRVHVIWHGANNGADIVPVKAAAYEFASLLGVNEKRFVFFTFQGQQTESWNGSRIVVATQEDAFAGINYISQLEAFYDTAFPKQHFSVRRELLVSAVGRTTPDPRFPGMTEAQVAATYGILPFSYSFDYAGKPFTAANLTSLGYHSAAGLPTGGVDKNYYIRTANGFVGNLIVNVSGTWTEYTCDDTHFNSAGATAIATQFNSFIILRNI